MTRWPVGSSRLQGHDYSATGAYFVTVCSFEKKLVFQNPTVQEVIESAWAEIPSHFTVVQLDAFVVMPNHVHGVLLMLENGRGDAGREAVGPLHATVLQPPVQRKSLQLPRLSVIVRSFKSAVTRELRIRGLHDGPIWQPNYHDRVVRDEAELNRIREYIAQNPVTWQHDSDNPQRTSNEAYERAWGWLEP